MTSDGRTSPVRSFPHQHLIENNTETVNVSASTEWLALRLLGAQIVGTTQRGAIQGQRTVGLQLFGDPKISQYGRSVLVEKYVSRFDIAMNDAMTMNKIQTLGNRSYDTKRRIGLYTGFDSMLEIPTLEKLHRNIRTLAHQTNVVNGDDVSMVEGRDDSALIEKPLGLGGRIALSKQLQSDIAIQGFLDSEVHRSHATFGDEPNQSIAGYFDFHALSGT